MLNQDIQLTYCLNVLCVHFHLLIYFVATHGTILMHCVSAIYSWLCSVCEFLAAMYKEVNLTNKMTEAWQ